MRRILTAVAAALLGLACLTGCGSSSKNKDVRACEAAYRAQQKAAGKNPSSSEVRRQCDRGNSNRSGYYGNAYYRSHSGGSSNRGGGSGSGK